MFRDADFRGVERKWVGKRFETLISRVFAGVSRCSDTASKGTLKMIILVRKMHEGFSFWCNSINLCLPQFGWSTEGMSHLPFAYLDVWLAYSRCPPFPRRGREGNDYTPARHPGKQRVGLNVTCPPWAGAWSMILSKGMFSSILV